jgi:hypothetical protein
VIRQRSVDTLGAVEEDRKARPFYKRMWSRQLSLASLEADLQDG